MNSCQVQSSRFDFGSCLVSFVLLCSGSVGAEVYHLRQNGSGDCATTQACVDRLKAGDTLLIHAGTFGGFNLRSLSGQPGKPVTIKAAPGEHAVLDGKLHTNPYGGVIYGNHPAYIVIGDSDGRLEITTTDPWVLAVRRLDMSKPADVTLFKEKYVSDPRINGGGIALEGGNRAHHLTVQHVEIHGLLGTGMVCGAHSGRFIGNRLYDLGYPRSGYGFYCIGDNHEFRRNVIHDVTYGMHLYNGKGKVLTNSVIDGNIISNVSLKPWHHMSSGAVKSNGSGILVSPGNGVLVRNNVVFRINGGGLILKGTNVRAFNNTVWSAAYGIDTVTPSEARNNILWQNKTNSLQQLASPNLIGVDPRFVDAAGGNLRLREESPARNTGVVIPECAYDLEGSRRGQKYDMGAYEFGAGVVPLTPGSFVVR